MKISDRSLRCVNTPHTKEVAGGGFHGFQVAVFISSVEVLRHCGLRVKYSRFTALHSRNIGAIQ